jgi:hypothetical protein
MNELTNSNINPVIYTDTKISEFACFAKVGIGYAFWMKIRYKEPDGIWLTSEIGDSVALGQTGKYDISDKMKTLPDGSLVQLDIQVRAGSENVYAEQCFVYSKESKYAAKYVASGTTYNAAIRLDELIVKI